MKMKNIRKCLAALCLLAASAWMSGCQTGAATVGSADTATAENRSLAPQRVDIRGNIIRRHYDQGQVMLEVDGFPSQYSRYNRAYVLVQPTTQIVDTDGQTISLSELRQGQNVAVLLRGGGEGNLMGVGVARKVWVEEIF